MWIGDGLFYITNGTHSFYWDQLSSFHCKARSFWYNASEIFIQWVLVLIGIERIIALYFPFKVRRWSTSRNSIILSLIILFFGILVGLISGWAYDLSESKAYRSGNSCLPKTKGTLDMWLHVSVAILGKFLVPVVILTIISVVLIWKIWKISKQNKRLTEKWSGRRRLNSEKGRDLRASMTIALLGFLHCVLYIPNAFIWASYYILSVFSLIPSDFAPILIGLGRIFLSLTIIVHVWNFYLYIIRIPAFRRDFFRIFSCRKCLPD